jgi:hypothetical protein
LRLNTFAVGLLADAPAIPSPFLIERWIFSCEAAFTSVAHLVYLVHKQLVGARAQEYLGPDAKRLYLKVLCAEHRQDAKSLAGRSPEALREP